MGTSARSQGQRVVGVAIDAELDALMQKASHEKGETPSQFIRKAIVESLMAKGYEATLSMASPPARTGKGGQPSHKKSKVNAKKPEEPAIVHRGEAARVMALPAAERAKLWPDDRKRVAEREAKASETEGSDAGSIDASNPKRKAS